MVTPGDRGRVRFEVKDTGIGIPAAKLSSIFEAFTQADGSTTRQYGGTGLGLAITRRLVNLMGGRLSAQSAPGSGSSFLFELPLEDRPAPTESSLAAPAQLSRRLPAVRILVAEDNLVNQKVVCSMIRREGWTAVLASNGQEAYDRYVAGDFHLILMDVQMPEVDGLQATRMIREEESRRGVAPISILGLTAHASRAQHDECLAQGMDAVITKPISLPALRKALSPVVESLFSPA
jgi:CheY-like chemotaxis protein